MTGSVHESPFDRLEIMDLPYRCQDAGFGFIVLDDVGRLFVIGQVVADCDGDWLYALKVGIKIIGSGQKIMMVQLSFSMKVDLCGSSNIENGVQDSLWSPSTSRVPCFYFCCSESARVHSKADHPEADHQ